jgi:hypothetical protein
MTQCDRIEWSGMGWDETYLLIVEFLPSFLPFIITWTSLPLSILVMHDIDVIIAVCYHTN